MSEKSPKSKVPNEGVDGSKKEEPEAPSQMSALVPLMWFAIPFLALIVYGVIHTWL
jgi:hypothetical protein